MIIGSFTNTKNFIGTIWFNILIPLFWKNFPNHLSKMTQPKRAAPKSFRMAISDRLAFMANFLILKFLVWNHRTPSKTFLILSNCSKFKSCSLTNFSTAL
ncbi:hypothetical protein BGP_0615 [Beggiatoa sp. PS]|nr:hypothetical protein BGP_0615 [Beggiatoa sp. PS]